MSTVQQAPAEFEATHEVEFGGFDPEGIEPSVASHRRASNDTTSAHPSDREYHPELGTRQLVAEVRHLLATERRAERLICRYLADLADRVRQRQDAALGAYADELHAARCFFGLGARDTRERVRIGRALRELPHIERAFINGDLSFSRVREVTRVATAQSEHAWLELAQQLDMRALERRVATARDSSIENGGPDAPDGSGERGGRDERGRARLDDPARAEWISPRTLRVTFQLSTDAWALLERALEGARRESASSLSDREALEAVARDALLVQTRDIEASDPRRAVVLYECQRCKQTEVDTGAGAVELEPSSAAALGCGAVVHDLEREGRGVSRGGPLPAAVRRAVMLRDHCRCRVPGCNRRRYVDVHHRVEQGRGGEHSRRNCLVLCTTHHRLLHEGKLTIEGDADRELCFRDSTGALIGMSRRPTRSPRAGGVSTDASPDALDHSATHLGSSNALDHSTAHVESSNELYHSATHVGSSNELSGPDRELGLRTTATGCRPSRSAPDHTTVEQTHLAQVAASFGTPVEPALRLLQIMGRRGGWSIDTLIAASGLSASQAAVTLTLLEVAGRIRWRDFTLEAV